MTFNYTLSAVMTMGHKIAKSLGLNTYRASLSKGLRKAWKIAKGLLPNVEGEKVAVINEDVQQEFAQQCLGNLVEDMSVAR